MGVSFGLALCLAYITGLLLSPIAGCLYLSAVAIPWSGIAGLGIVAGWGIVAPRRWRLGWRPVRWGSLGVVVLLAAIYLTMRSPTPGANDISHFIERAEAIGPHQVIVGKVVDSPQLNRDVKGRFIVSVEQLQVLDATGTTTFQMPVRGRIYVTAPLLQITGLHSGQRLKAIGHLYRPQPAMNPNGFNFQAYLAQQNAFTGFAAEELRFSAPGNWGLWRVRQRIVRTQIKALGSPLGQMVSAMALGRKAVDLPADIQAVFTRVGLAHTIAASGFHVSLLLGVVLAILQWPSGIGQGRSRRGNIQLIVGFTVLVSYVILTGAQASIIRAALMGGAVLIGLATGRSVLPVGALLTAATLMLLINPHWLWSISFQLSVMATWGLIVTVPAITKRLDWLPVTVASGLAVPIAATVWTLPLTLYHFNVFAGLSILLNVIAMPLITVTSLGGMISSACAMILPPLGAILASWLYFPARGLLWLAETCSQLPGSSIAIGQISLWQLAGLYAVLFGSLGLHRYRHRSLKPLIAIAFLALILCPLGWRWLTQDQITVLAAGNELIWVQQDHGRTTLVNSGDTKTAFYTVEPFLTQAGINHIENAIALPFSPDYLSGWQSLFAHVPTKHLYSSETTALELGSKSQFHQLKAGASQHLESLDVQLLGTDNPIVRLSDRQSWLLLPDLPSPLQQHLAKAGTVLQSHVLVWSGGELTTELLNAVNPQVAICYGRQLRESVERDLQQTGIQVFWTQRDGAITWQPRRGFHSYLETTHRINLLAE